jgi:hypothetical protein
MNQLTTEVSTFEGLIPEGSKPPRESKNHNMSNGASNEESEINYTEVGN